VRYYIQIKHQLFLKSEFLRSEKCIDSNPFSILLQPILKIKEKYLNKMMCINKNKKSIYKKLKCK
jgi:hypothetical protein